MAAKRWILFTLGLLIGVTLVVVGATLMSFETPLCAHVFCPYVPDVASTEPTYPWASSLMILGAIVMGLSVYLIMIPFFEKHYSSQ